MIDPGHTRHIRTRWKPKSIKVPEDIESHLRPVLEAVLTSGMTWDEIAADAGVSVDTIKFWYRKRHGERTLSPSFHLVCAVAAAVGLELQWKPAPRRIAADGYALADDQ